MTNDSSGSSDADKGAKDTTGRLDPKRKRQLVGAGVAFGIGSAAIVAALLYANRGRRGDKGGS